MDIISVVIFILGGIIGFAIRHFTSKNSGISQDDNFQSLSTLEKEKTALQKDVEHLENRIEKSIEEFNKQREREKVLIDEKIDLSSKLSISETNLKNLSEKLSSQKEELNQLQEKFTKEFKLAADAILKQNSQDFSKAHTKELDDILAPLKEKIRSFEESVEKKYVDETKERSSLKQEIKQLLDLNKTLNLQAENLTTALKGENKTQGNWGEMVLERILESSGLIKGEEYDKQFSDTNADNKRIQPDIVIKLPEDKHIIIDSKVSLSAYERFVNDKDENERENHLKAHLVSVKSHVKQLSDKNYQTGIGVNSPDFVLLFMPIEPSFTLAAQYDSGLFNYAWDRKVVIVSPTTLLATLRTIASVWKNERKIKNAMEISENAAKLYDKFKGFVDDMQKIGKGLHSAQNSYDEAFSKLSTGRGNLISRTEKFRELGVTPTKELPKELIEPTLENE